jgi:hypothetical protein
MGQEASSDWRDVPQLHRHARRVDSNWNSSGGVPKWEAPRIHRLAGNPTRPRRTASPTAALPESGDSSLAFRLFGEARVSGPRFSRFLPPEGRGGIEGISWDAEIQGYFDPGDSGFPPAVRTRLSEGDRTTASITLLNCRCQFAGPGASSKSGPFSVPIRDHKPHTKQLLSRILIQERDSVIRTDCPGERFRLKRRDRFCRC